LPVLRLVGWIGDISAAMGKRIPIDSQRVLRMTESYPVPFEPTFAVCGMPEVSFEAGAAESLPWLESLGGVYA
jgi:hypothetical protein